jgi:hypothetical protein
MLWRFYEKRFPNASVYERRRKIAVLTIVIGAIRLVGAVVLVMR